MVEVKGEGYTSNKKRFKVSLFFPFVIFDMKFMADYIDLEEEVY